MSTTPPPPPPPGGDWSQQPAGDWSQQPGGSPQQPGGWPQQPAAGGDDRTIAVLAHLSPLIAMIISVGWLSFLGPLIFWLIWRDRGPLVRNAAASAFNFNITVWLANIAGWVCFFTIILIPVAIVLWAIAWIAQIALSILGAVRASRGEVYRYPMQVPILS